MQIKNNWKVPVTLRVGNFVGEGRKLQWRDFFFFFLIWIFRALKECEDSGSYPGTPFNVTGLLTFCFLATKAYWISGNFICLPDMSLRGLNPLGSFAYSSQRLKIVSCAHACQQLSSKLLWLDLTMFLQAGEYMACNIFWFYTTVALQPFSSKIGNIRFCDARNLLTETQMKHLASI